MKLRFFGILIFLLLSTTLFSQEFPKVDSLLDMKFEETGELVLNKNYPENWREIDDVILKLSNLIFTTTDTINNQRDYAMGLIIEGWLGKGNNTINYQDEISASLVSIDFDFYLYYLVAICKCYLENPTFTENELKLNSVGILLNYFLSDYVSARRFDELNDKKYFIDLVKAYNDNSLPQYLNLK